MAAITEKKGAVSLKAYRGDAKTLLAFNLDGKPARTRLAGFTIQVTPPGVNPYYIQNNLRFEHTADHAQDPLESAFSSINAPIHKFRWLHVPGSVHQGLAPVFGIYTYTVTPRYFDKAKSLLAIDPAFSVAVKIDVKPFEDGKLAVGFTRGFTQSQAFVRHFGLKAVIRPKKAGLMYDTSAVSGTNAAGESFTFAQQYEWSGFTARKQIFAILKAVKDDNNLKLDVFAYDLNEPDLIKALLDLGHTKRVRIILDNAALHHDKTKPKPEDEFEKLFAAKVGTDHADYIKRGNFGRYAHDKVFIVYDQAGPKRVMTGSTNFSVTGFYVNSNHILVFEDSAVAKLYADVFQKSWDDNLSDKKFKATSFATQPFDFGGGGLPEMSITFAPHDKANAKKILGGLVTRVAAESKAKDGKGSVLFAVMALDGGKENPVYDALKVLHKSQKIFSYGVSDTTKGIALHKVGSKAGVLVTGRPTKTQLPPPFNQVPGVGIGHQVHHKFVVCGFNTKDAVVYCGSSNLALAGEQVNGDNLLEIRDEEVATVFAIEALGLVDHFEFLDRVATAPKAKSKAAKTPAALKQQAAAAAGWFLGTTDAWVAKYFDKKDLRNVDRELFSG